ncbi:MAG: hypothetical protein RIC55_30170 [Pirellulaceae bacterium]
MNRAPLESLSTMRYMGRVEPDPSRESASRFPAFHPLLLAMFPPLTLYAQNPGGVQWWELLAAVGATLLGAGLVYAVARRLYVSQQAAALATSWTILLVFGYGLIFHLEGLLADWDLPLLLTPRTVLPLWGGVLVFGLWSVGRKGVNLRVGTQCANVFGVCAVVGPAALVLFDTGGDVSSLLGNDVEIESVGPIDLESAQPLPDVYYLVISGYADSETLSEEFRIDNREFLEGLKRRGFAVAEQSQTNYPSPELSMASALNLCYLGETIGPKSQYYDLLQQNRMARELKSLGYRYYHLGGPIDGLRTSPLADENYRFSRMPSNYTDRLIELTPLAAWLGSKSRRVQMQEKFDRLDLLAKQNGPKFVLMYIAALQPPWTFDAQGNAISPRTAGERGDAESYSQQLSYLNRRLRHAIDDILEYTKGDAVILLQADEGPRLIAEGNDQQSRRAEWERRCGVLTAVYLPDGKTRRGVAASLSPVNTLRLVLHECFGAKLPRLADDSYVWQGSDADGAPLFGRRLPLTEVDQMEATTAGLSGEGR